MSKCRRADLKLEVAFGPNGTIGTVVIWWDLILYGNRIIFIHYTILFSNPNSMPSNKTIKTCNKSPGCVDIHKKILELSCIILYCYLNIILNLRNMDSPL